MEIEFFFDPENAKCPYLDELDVKLRIIPERDVAAGVKEPGSLDLRRPSRPVLCLMSGWRSSWAWPRYT